MPLFPELGCHLEGFRHEGDGGGRKAVRGGGGGQYAYPCFLKVWEAELGLKGSAVLAYSPTLGYGIGSLVRHGEAKDQTSM